MRTPCKSVASQRKIQLLSVSAHPANLAARHAYDQREIRNISVNNRAGADEAVSADSRPAHDGAVGAKRRAGANQGAQVLVLAGDGGTRIVNICEDHARTAKDIVLDLNGVIDGDVVLDLYVIPNANVIAHEDVLPERTLAPNAGARADMDEVPYTTALSQHRTFVHECGGMDRGFHAMLTGTTERRCIEFSDSYKQRQIRSRRQNPTKIRSETATMTPISTRDFTRSLSKTATFASAFGRRSHRHSIIK
jgi:hypothetical protein